MSLPVLGGGGKGPIRPSRNAKRRAMVLIGVHVVFVVHVLLWLYFGRTLSPVEPSESMYTLETGVVNAGFVFFVLAILATLIFGRFFCGWACHVVALQDLCAWMLKKVGIRPRAFRSRLLVYAPLFFALYMFVWPTFRREALAPLLARVWPGGLAYIGEVRPFPGFSDGLIVEDFWATFPGPWVAVPFLFVCGFACVYFLGAKGFCTYGCPYGGFFAPADKVAPGRILVDHDKCEGCGHCTAVCTSNVRVHEEIRDFGMVVDPGCMKCMDCVSVCPNDALSFGFGAPPVAKSVKRGRVTERAPGVKPGATRTYDLGRGEEIAVALVFVGAYLATRGAYGVIPMLMAIGVAGCVAYIAWKVWRMVLDRSVRLHNFQLRLKGSVRPAGWAFVAFALLTLGVTAQAGAVRALLARAASVERGIVVPVQVVLEGRRDAIPEDQMALASRAARLHRLASPVWEGGIGLAWTPGRLADGAYVLAVTGDYAGAERALRALVRRTGGSEQAARNIATLMALQGRAEEAIAHLTRVLDEHPSFHGLRAEVAASLAEAGRVEEAEALFTRAIERSPGDGVTYAQRGAIRVAMGRMEEGLRDFARAVEASPDDPQVRQQYGAALFVRGDVDGAIAQMRTALELDEFDHVPALRIAQMLNAAGRLREAGPYLDMAEQRRAKAAERAAAGGPGATHGHVPSATTVTRD